MMELIIQQRRYPSQALKVVPLFYFLPYCLVKWEVEPDKLKGNLFIKKKVTELWVMGICWSDNFIWSENKMGTDDQIFILKWH